MALDPKYWEQYVRHHNPGDNAIIINKENYFAIINKHYNSSTVNQARYIRSDPKSAIPELIEIFTDHGKDFSIVSVIIIRHRD